MAVALTAALMTVGSSSCSSVYDDLDPCPRGVLMRFVFDYNLEFANAFPNQVDCLSLWIFDAEGNLLQRVTETSDVLADEDWRMTIDLPAGDYKAVAYGGLECDLSSFSHTTAAENVRTITDLQVALNVDHIGDEAARPARPLHDLYHGALDFTVTEGTDYDRVTLRMMRDTNHIRLVLQHIDNSPVDDKDFTFEILDDNTLLGHDNSVIPVGETRYTPWTTGTAHAGLNGLPVEDENDQENGDEGTRAAGDPVQVAYAEMSVSRLIHRSGYQWTDSRSGQTMRGPRLRITSKENGRVVADLPLNNYLLMLKSDYFGSMDSQEYLDRASRHNLVFFLDHDNAWVEMHIVVEDWTVRINNIEY